ncbi:hypothetical protein B0H10DRAFT_1951421 [Mycena sp. CBHHK59/15]|nr:hypothetical protein B0H10DRAFT_1951421 [Mycena sp. CBHHK59/15]
MSSEDGSGVSQNIFTKFQTMQRTEGNQRWLKQIFDSVKNRVQRSEMDLIQPITKMRNWQQHSETCYCQSLWRRPSTPYERASAPDGQASTSDKQASTPDGQASTPYGQASALYEQASTPDGQASAL